MGPPVSVRYASEVNIRGTPAGGKNDGADDFWNFEQLQREKAMLAEEVARLAQTCQAATSEKSRLSQAVREKDKKIAFLHEEKDMLTQVRPMSHAVHSTACFRQRWRSCSSEGVYVTTSIVQLTNLLPLCDFVRFPSALA